jgi:hypothetical protein
MAGPRYYQGVWQTGLIVLILTAWLSFAFCMPSDAKALDGSDTNKAGHEGVVGGITKASWTNWFNQMIAWRKKSHKVLCEKEDWRSASFKVDAFCFLER